MRVELLAGDRLEVDEVEAQAIGRHERSRLLDVSCRAPARSAAWSRCVAVWFRRVASRTAASTSAVTMSADCSAPADTRTRCARGRPGWIRTSPSTVAERAGGFVDDAAGVGHLAAGLEVERRPRERDVAGGPRGQRVDRLAFLVEQRHDRHAGDAGGRVALELIAAPFSAASSLDAKSAALFSPPNALLPARGRAAPPSPARSRPDRPARPGWLRCPR